MLTGFIHAISSPFQYYSVRNLNASNQSTYLPILRTRVLVHILNEITPRTGVHNMSITHVEIKDRKCGIVSKLYYNNITHATGTAASRRRRRLRTDVQELSLYFQACIIRRFSGIG